MRAGPGGAPEAVINTEDCAEERKLLCTKCESHLTITELLVH